VKVSRTVWSGGKFEDNIKELPITIIFLENIKELSTNIVRFYSEKKMYLKQELSLPWQKEMPMDMLENFLKKITSP